MSFHFESNTRRIIILYEFFLIEANNFEAMRIVLQ